MVTKKYEFKRITKPVLNLILLGDPGAGKATQAEYFAKKYKMFDFDMGRELTLLRDRSQKASETLRKNYDKGNLAPTNMVRGIIKEKFATLPKSKGILFDGHPKMLGEAKIIHGLLNKTGRTKPLVLYLRIPQDEVIKRVLKRKGYRNTKFSTRLMDTKSGLRNRAKYYRKNIAEVVEFFRNNYIYANIDGMGTRRQVRARLQKAVEFYLKNYDLIFKNEKPKA